MKNKVILLNFLPAIDASYSHKGSIYPSTASMLIGTILKQGGFDVAIIDGAFHEDYIDKLKSMLTDDVIYVGMTVMTTQISFALEASKVIKAVNPTIKVVWGGPHPTLFPAETLQDNNIDIVVINEGADTSLKLAHNFRDGRSPESITGIGFKNQSGMHITEPADLDNLNELPFFDFSLIELENYLNPASSSVYQREFPLYNNQIRVMPILTALGCPYKCQFCFNVILKRKYRFKSAESIVSEIKKLIAKYDANTFFFLDEDFFINKKRVLEFIDLVEKEQLHFNWRMWCRVDHFKDNYINRDLINRLAAIGHGSLVMGGESANQEILDALCKGITPEQIKNSLNTISGTRIMPRYSFMVGLEDENIEQIQETYRFCLELHRINPDVDISGPFIFRLYPGSPIYDRIVKKYDIDIPSDLEKWIVLLKEESTYTHIPWTPEKFQKITHLLTFYSTFAFMKKTDMGRTIKGTICRIISSFSKFRLKYFIFQLPFEYWLVNKYLK
ncbi:MAG: B12-binding domain-containing radical SAM protein [Methanomicrobiaceae archaeon]|nr:B12-binding domain-containing radical SAM protein [Methanomicrobiaceae archaeon]